jgi:TolA-binding protein
LQKNFQLNHNLNEAITAYKSVIQISKSEFSAEAQYRIAEIYLLQNKLTEAEKAGFEVIKKYGSYEYWVTKSYILLGDIYFIQKDYFNAEATFKSVAENATIAELKQEAEQKLAKVIEEKNKTNKVEQP